MKSCLITVLLVVSVLCMARGIHAQSAPPASTDATLGTDGKPLPGTSIPCAPIAEKRQELGCYVIARQKLVLPQGPMSWHLDTFATHAAAEAAKGPRGVVTEAFERTWLLTIDAPDWRPAGGSAHVASVGPLPLEPRAAQYTAFYVATTFRPGLASFVHEHPGPEAWFIVSGEQCLETPDGALPGRAGEGFVVRGNLPMVVRATGTEIRRNFALVLHDASKEVTSRVEHWKPRGLCHN